VKLNRRTFLFAVGGATAGIAGWVLIPKGKGLHPRGESADAGFCPRLAKDVGVRKSRGGAEIVRPDESGKPNVICRVNTCGLSVVEDLNGSHTIRQLAQKIHKGEPAGMEHTEASVASFLAMLGQVGLLSESL